MTFGQTLKQLLTLSGMKSAHLADALGYDTSYISRWVNDIKLPSLKNNDDLFLKISRTIVGGSDEAAIERLCQAYGSEYAWLEETLESTLKTAYDNASKQAQGPSLSHNASLLLGGHLPDPSSVFADAIIRSAEEKGSGTVNVTVTIPLNIYSNRNMDFWRDILANPAVGGSLSITVEQVIEMSSFKANIDSYCAAIMTLLRFDKGVRYEFLLGDSAAGSGCSFISIENSLMCCVLENWLTHEDALMLCSDQGVMRQISSKLSSSLKYCQPLISYSDKNELEASHFLYDFVMSGSLRYLLTVMHPIYIDEGFLSELAARYNSELPDNEFHMYYNNLCSNTEREVILYRTALLEYIYSGRIYLFGREIQLDKADRAEHLKQLLENMRSGACTLKILNDENPLLCRKDTRLSVYLSRSTGFMASNESGWYSSFRFCSHRIVELFNTFFTHLWQLDGEYLLTGSDAEEFIRRGLMLM